MILSLVIGTFFGICAMYIMAKTFLMMRKLQSSGTMNMYDVLGEDGNVYLTIPPEGIGKVQIEISGRLKVVDAMSQGNQEFTTGDTVHVVDIDEDSIVVVTKK